MKVGSPYGLDYIKKPAAGPIFHLSSLIFHLSSQRLDKFTIDTRPGTMNSMP